MSDMTLIVPAGREGRITEAVHLPDADEICRNLQKTENGRWVSIWLHQDIIHYLDMIARQRGVGRSTLIRDIVVTYITNIACRRHVSQ